MVASWTLSYTNCISVYAWQPDREAALLVPFRDVLLRPEINELHECIEAFDLMLVYDGVGLT